MSLRKMVILLALLWCFGPLPLSAQSEIVISGDVQSVDPSADDQPRGKPTAWGGTLHRQIPRQRADHAQRNQTRCTDQICR